MAERLIEAEEVYTHMRLTIIGGAGAMGRWFAAFFKANGAEVRIVDTNANTGEIAKRLGVQFSNTDVLMEGKLNEEILNVDVVLISVPIDITARVIERIGPKMHAGSLLMDITTVKKMPVETMQRCTNVGVEILGSHPLFGPSTKSMQGQTVIFVPSKKGQLYERIYELFEGAGAKIELLTAAEHDEIMVVIQGLTHFVLISFGIALKNLDFDVAKSRKYMNPMVAILIDFVGRLLHQDPHLSALIQTNFEMGEVHEAFLSGANRLFELVSAGNVEEFMAETRMAVRHFGDTKRAQLDSDKIIEEQINLSSRKSIIDTD
ncbi:prephenate dehydrogenase/arogenate dehydrogenase family protein [ANME-1 cluster archaeon AG-394-G06]|nr:prephenate dehydrogenase/arogenate dehydrogenase family protein [ANME-1 cluster archaeon AG-394-G06]